MRIVLASSSPRRRELLARIAYPFAIVPADVDETQRAGEAPDLLVRRLAAEKACRVSGEHRDAAVLGSDTIVVLGGEVLGKPVDERDAASMLERLSGSEHEVLTAVAWARDGEVCAADMTRSRVRFRRLSEREIADYVATGDPLDKAGAYGIQAGASSFVRGVLGSTTGVIGLPLAETERAARSIGVPEPAGPLPAEAVALRYRALVAEVAGLAVACGREAREVRLVAVSKGHPPESVAAAVAAGARDLGENYVQEAAAKREALAMKAIPGDGSSADPSWHLIGRLQSNKAAVAARTFDVVHTLDRPEIARALVERARTLPVRGLLQVNITRDAAKAGVAPEAVPGLVAELAHIDGLSLEGLMAIGPDTEDESASRAAFEELRASLDRLRAMGYERLRELSMGMSDDYPAAIAAGATWLRIGTAVFGPRTTTRG